jgi:hypothetical protein
VAVEPPLIGGERAGQERDADEGDDDLDHYTRRQVFGAARLISCG